jgi:PEGA domain-containing protein
MRESSRLSGLQHWTERHLGHIGAFERSQQLHFERRTAILLCAEYLSAELYQIGQSSGRPQVIQNISEKGQSAFRKYLDQVSNRSEVASVNSFLAEELGRGALTVPKRNKYGNIQIESKPNSADVLLDDDPEIVAKTKITLILLVGNHQVRCSKPPLREFTASITIESGKTVTVACEMRK